MQDASQYVRIGHDNFLLHKFNDDAFKFVEEDKKLQKESNLDLLAIVIQSISEEYWRKNTAELLAWTYWTILKWYDDEEQFDCLKQDCLSFWEDPSCFRQ